MDIQTISASLSTIKTAGDIIKAMIGVTTDAKINSNIIKLQNVILELQGNLISIQGDISVLLREQEELKSKLETKEKMIFKYPFWYIEGDEVPFCPKCWESNAKLIHLTSGDYTGGKHYCKVCDELYED